MLRGRGFGDREKAVRAVIRLQEPELREILTKAQAGELAKYVSSFIGMVAGRESGGHDRGRHR